MVKEKSLENEIFSRSGKSQGISISVREILKNDKSQGNVREFENFQKVDCNNRPLKSII